MLIKQFRKPIEKILYEIPAGKVEINEEPKEAAIRELKEETGYKAEKFKYLLEFYTSPGFCNEKIHLFLAQELSEVDSNPDSDEFVETVKIHINDLDKMIDRGEIVDGKTIIGIYLAKEYFKEK